MEEWAKGRPKGSGANFQSVWQNLIACEEIEVYFSNDLLTGGRGHGLIPIPFDSEIIILLRDRVGVTCNNPQTPIVRLLYHFSLRFTCTTMFQLGISSELSLTRRLYKNLTVPRVCARHTSHTLPAREPGKVHDQSSNNIGGGMFNIDFSATTKDPVNMCKQNP